MARLILTRAAAIGAAFIFAVFLGGCASRPSSDSSDAHSVESVDRSVDESATLELELDVDVGASDDEAVSDAERKRERQFSNNATPAMLSIESPEYDDALFMPINLTPPAIPGEPRLFDPLRESDIIAYYGHPQNRYLGILGEFPIDEMTDRLIALAKEYDELNGKRSTIPAFHIIFAIVHPDATTTPINHDVLVEYITYAMRRDIIVIIDHQLGDANVETAVMEMLPYLRYPNVHLAIDPEWSTDEPGKKLGSVAGEEINDVKRVMEEYLISRKLPGKRMLVVHQFNYVMIRDPEDIRGDSDYVTIVHNADGFGPPEDKYKSWEALRKITTMPIKGFKLFYEKPWRDWGSDVTLMTPLEVLALEPRPVLIMYQ